MNKSLAEHTNIILYVIILSICSLLSVAFIYLYSQSHGNVTSFSENLGRLNTGILNLPSDFLNYLISEWWLKILLIILVYALYRYVSYEFYKKKTATRIYERIRETLRSHYNAENIEHGLSIDQIISIFSKEFNISEADFKNILLPILREMRKKDNFVREFQKRNNGKLSWQWNE